MIRKQFIIRLLRKLTRYSQLAKPVKFSKKPILSIGLGLALINLSYAASLCQPNERVIYSCTTSGNKLVSLCASGAANNDRTVLYYRFGKANHVELTYPRDNIPARAAFQGRSQMFSGGGGIYLRFNNGHYDYVIYSGTGKGWQVDGVVILKNQHLMSYIPCQDKSLLNLSPQDLADLRINTDSDEQEFFPGDIADQLKTASPEQTTTDSSFKACYDKAANTFDLRLCADQEYKYYDKQLNETYQNLMQVLTDQSRQALMNAQRSWLQFRKTECDFAGQENEGGTLQPLTILSCYNKLTKERINDLKGYIEDYNH